MIAHSLLVGRVSSPFCKAIRVEHQEPHTKVSSRFIRVLLLVGSSGQRLLASSGFGLLGVESSGQQLLLSLGFGVLDKRGYEVSPGRGLGGARSRGAGVVHGGACKSRTAES